MCLSAGNFSSAWKTEFFNTIGQQRLLKIHEKTINAFNRWQPCKFSAEGWLSISGDLVTHDFREIAIIRLIFFLIP
jgi:hypothetical protein